MAPFASRGLTKLGATLVADRARRRGAACWPSDAAVRAALSAARARS